MAEKSNIENKSEVARFLGLIERSRRGKFKVYIGMAAGVGKTYRMLQEAHQLLSHDIDVKIGFIETHGRKETHALTEGIPTIPLKKVFYKGKQIEEMDLDAILIDKPEVVLVDELPHTNVPGSKNEKRWQDVVEILKAGINVISAMNIQHIESLNNVVKEITGIEVSERVPDSVLEMADEIVNIDLTSDELIQRLKDGKIYDPSKVEKALNNFFQKDALLQLRELSLQESAGKIGRLIERDILNKENIRGNKILACISSNADKAKYVIRRAAKLASLFMTEFAVLYIQTPNEGSSKIDLADQRHLINNFKMATEMGGDVVKLKDADVARRIVDYALENDIRWIVMANPTRHFWNKMGIDTIVDDVLKKIDTLNIDLIIVSRHET
ncbi:sensor protein KdpD [Gracilimonas sediminicola]|uniref:sensor protein KdpD n=1 Tax=Gracilimonas sediminicola TaxID=2952158 RepID=UPI0038D35EFE